MRIGVRIEERRGDDGAGTMARRRRRGHDDAGTTARRHGDDGGQVLAITTSASMTRARQHGGDGTATTRRARCDAVNGGVNKAVDLGWKT